MDEPSTWAAEFLDLQSRPSSHWRRRQVWNVWLTLGLLAAVAVVWAVMWPADYLRGFPLMIILLGIAEHKRLGVLRGAAEVREITTDGVLVP